MAVISTLTQSRNTTQSFSVSITSRPDIDPKWRGRIFRQGGRALLCYIVRVIVAVPYRNATLAARVPRIGTFVKDTQIGQAVMDEFFGLVVTCR